MCLQLFSECRQVNFLHGQSDNRLHGLFNLICFHFAHIFELFLLLLITVLLLIARQIFILIISDYLCRVLVIILIMDCRYWNIVSIMISVNDLCLVLVLAIKQLTILILRKVAPWQHLDRRLFILLSLLTDFFHVSVNLVWNQACSLLHPLQS